MSVVKLKVPVGPFEPHMMVASISMVMASQGHDPVWESSWPEHLKVGCNRCGREVRMVRTDEEAFITGWRFTSNGLLGHKRCRPDEW
jgi:hypothetical protein